MSEKTSGQVAYESWCSVVIYPPTWPWDALPQTAQSGWEMIANAVMTHSTCQNSTCQKS